MSEELMPIKLIDQAYNRLTQNSLLLIISNVSAAVLNFGISVLIGRELGQAGFGRWVFLMAWASGITILCEFGMNTLLTRKVANSPDSLNSFLFSTLSIKILFVLIVGSVVWIASPALGLDQETSQGLRYVVFIVLSGVMYGSFSATFRALGFMFPIAVLNISSLLFQLIGMFWILQRDGQVLSLIQWMAVTSTIQLGFAFVFWFFRLARSGGEIKSSLASNISMLKASVPFAFAGIVGAIQMRSSVILLGYIRNEGAAGIFGSASRFSEAAKLIPNGIFDAAFPLFAKTESNIAKQKLLFRQINGVISLYSLLIGLPLVFLSTYIMRWTFGDDFISASPVLIWLGISLLPTLNNAVIELYLYASGDEKFAVQLGFVALSVQVLFGIPLMYFYGATGAAISVLFGELAIWLPLQLRLKSFIGEVTAT